MLRVLHEASRSRLKFGRDIYLTPCILFVAIIDKQFKVLFLLLTTDSCLASMIENNFKNLG
jgi:hypothetical protein